MSTRNASRNRCASAIPHGAFTRPAKRRVEHHANAAHFRRESARPRARGRPDDSGCSALCPARTSPSNHRRIGALVVFRRSESGLCRPWRRQLAPEERTRAVRCGDRAPYSPCQKGIRAGAPGAGITMTRSCSMLSVARWPRRAETRRRRASRARILVELSESRAVGGSPCRGRGRDRAGVQHGHEP